MDENVTDVVQGIKVKSKDKIAYILDKVTQVIQTAKEKKEIEEESDELLQNLRNAQNDWVMATINYEFAYEEELVDYYSYLIKANQIKYNYLLKKLKEREAKLSADTNFEQLHMEKRESIV